MSKEAQPKRNVYVGGLEEQVNEEILHAAFVPFGDVVEVSISGYQHQKTVQHRFVYDTAVDTGTRYSASRHPR